MAALRTRFLEESWRDVRHAGRSLRANPIVSIVIVLSLALGVGANTAIFSIVNALLLRTLPVQEPERLVSLGDAASDARAWSNPVWEEVRSHSALADGAFAWAPDQFNLTRGGEARFAQGLFASGGFFDVLGVPAALGRTFSAADDRRNGGVDGPVAVISDGFWRRWFGGTPDAIGKPLTLGSATFTVIGVTPASFFGPEVGRRFDVVLPLGTEPLLLGANSALQLGGRTWLRIAFRLKEGQSLDAGTAALRGVQPQIRAATLAAMPQAARPRHLETPFALTPASTGRSPLRTQYARPLVTLMIIVGAVLFIACLNIVNLMLARADARRHEMSLRTSLGASRGQLVRMVLTEVLAFTTAGTLLGIWLSDWISSVLVQQLTTPNNVVSLDLAYDWRVWSFSLAMAAGAALVIGVVPAWQSGRADPGEALKERGRSVTGGARSPVGAALVIGQVSLSLVLIVAAGLFVRTFANLATRDVGFSRDRVLVVNVTAPMTAYTLPRLVAVYDRVREAVAAVPGVVQAAISDITPIGGAARETNVEIPGSSLPANDRLVSVNVISPGWLATYGTRLVAGRDLAPTDQLNSPRVALVNEAFVRHFLGDASPVGRTIGAGGPGAMTQFEIVGVVQDAAYRSLRDPAPPTIYTSTAQREAARPFVNVSVSLPREAAAVTTQAITEAIRQVDPNLVLRFTPLTEQVGAAMNQERILALLSGFLGALALLLAGLGLYGLTAYAVARRRAEVAIRMALGGSTGGVVWLVVRRIGVLIVAGVAGGAVLSLWASRFVGTLMWGVEPHDAVTFLAAALILMAVGAFAAWLPARRAARIDPLEVLREG